MKTIGIIGGLGPEATVDYYKTIINRFNEINNNGTLNYPEIIIYSVNMSQLIGFMHNKEYDNVVEYLTRCIKKLGDAGAEFAAITANTPHLLFNEIQHRSILPLVSIVEAARNEAVKLKIGRAGLIGTKFTMRASFYQDVFSKSAIEIIVPSPEDIEIINEKLFSEIELGIFKDETRQLMLDIIEKMIRHSNIDSLILGCTEFPLMFTNEKYFGIPFLNTTGIHVDEIVKKCMES